MSYFATDYTIHFDDTMAYGSHHFLTAFKFQCASREAFLFGEKIFDLPGVERSLDDIHLFTADAYARNLHPARLGERVAILLTLEEWGRASARFCYRVINKSGQPICAGFQTLICADAKTGEPIALPDPLWNAMEQLRAIEEPRSEMSFRDRVLAGGSQIDAIFSADDCQTAITFLQQRYPSPQVFQPVVATTATDAVATDAAVTDTAVGAEPDVVSPGEDTREVWVFSGQGAFDAKLLSERIQQFIKADSTASEQLSRCVDVVRQVLEVDASAVVSGSPELCAEAVKQSPDLSQVAIHLQNTLGALLYQTAGHVPAVLMGHSFGEIAALGVSGCFDLATGVRVVCYRVLAIRAHAPSSGGLLAVAAQRPQVETEATLLGLDQVVIAGRNHDRQTAASGPIDQLERLRDYFQSVGISAVLVPTPTSFHHPQLRQAMSAWLADLRAIEFSVPNLPVYTPIGRRFIDAQDDIAATMASQFVRPFDLQGAVDDLIESGATHFIDCGSAGSLGRILTKAVREAAAVAQSDLPASMPTAAPAEPTVGTDPAPVREIDDDESVPLVAIAAQGCILPGGASSPERLFTAITDQRLGIVDQRQFDPDWEEDFYSKNLQPDRSTSPLTGMVNNEDIVVPDGVDPQVFEGFTRTQKLLCIALAPCVASVQGAKRILCLMGSTADGFEDQDEATSLCYAGIDPTDPLVDGRMQTARWALQMPHDAVKEVFDKIVRPGLQIVLVDAACASSLYAVALGMQAIESGEADAVIAGGVFCPGPGNSCLFSQFHGTTSTGCRPFDANSDGVVFSEGAALVTLRRLADAEDLGLPVGAVLRGTGLSSDGRSSSANVPQTHGQILSLKRCYANYGIDPATIDAIEGHGTSTRVGDSTELETLRQFFEPHASGPIPVHSLKGLLGHAGWAAGTASIIAVCQYLRNGVFPAQSFHQTASKALDAASQTLHVPHQPQQLPAGNCRIAIDGFGFGGANAHVVLDRYLPEATPRQGLPTLRDRKKGFDHELVVVAMHEVKSTEQSAMGLRFDRNKLELPQGHIFLPDLQEDMDISQLLAVILVDGVLQRLPSFDDAMRDQTSIVLAQTGKTDRGVEATMRVLAQRFRRRLQGLESQLAELERVYDQSKPSGPYTLQCMMPNVSSGRAALRFDTHGPNFVVDSGDDSLESALESAALLLRSGEYSGTKMVILAAIDANPWRVSWRLAGESHDEFAVALGVTTRSFAEQKQLPILSTLDDRQFSAASAPEQSTHSKVRSLLQSLFPETGPTPPLEPSEFPVHVPVWVNSPLGELASTPKSLREKSVLALVRDDAQQLSQVSQSLCRHAKDYQVLVVGANASRLVPTQCQDHCVPADLDDEAQLSAAFARLDGFAFDVILAFDQVANWTLPETLAKVATDNKLCESLFLTCQHYVDRLRSGEMEVWSIFWEGWNGSVHPQSGAMAGLLKAVEREVDGLHTRTVCTRGLSLEETCERLMAEGQRSQSETELVFDGQQRFVRRLRESDSPASERAPVALDANSVVVATGGAQGVTAVLADALIRDYGCRVIALGRSALEAGPKDPSDPAAEREFYQNYVAEHPQASGSELKAAFAKARARWEAYRTIERLGSQAEYMVTDVADRRQVDRTIAQIAAKYGRIDLLVHGAGVQYSKRLEHRTLSEFRTTYSIKVLGLHYLVGACQRQFGRTVNAHVLTSAYSVFGNDGQHDYGAANETLDRLCQMTTDSGAAHWSSIAWLAWDGIGMTRGTEYQALAKSRGLSGLTFETGQQVFRKVFSGATRSAINVPMSRSEHVRYQIKTIPAGEAIRGGKVMEFHVDLSKIDCLAFHKVRNTPTLPGAWIVDRMVDAALHFRGDATSLKSAIVHDATFRRFVRYRDGDDPNLRVIAEATSGGIVTWMIGDILHPSGTCLAKDEVFAHAVIGFDNSSSDLQPSLDEEESADSATATGLPRLVNDPYCNRHGGEVELSGPFDCVRDISIGATGRHARFVPNMTQASPSGTIPALLLDSAWRVGAMYAVPEKDELYVPVQIGRLIVPVGERSRNSSSSSCFIRASAPRVEDGRIRWDRTEVFDEMGAMRMLVENAFATKLQ